MRVGQVLLCVRMLPLKSVRMCCLARARLIPFWRGRELAPFGILVCVVLLLRAGVLLLVPVSLLRWCRCDVCVCV